MRAAHRLLSLTILLLGPTVVPAIAEEPFAPQGRFELIDSRTPAESAATIVDTQPTVPAYVDFGPALYWLDGRECRTWHATPWNGVPFDLHDPALSDMLVGPADGRPNHRLVALFEIVCDGEGLGSLTFVDERVAIGFQPDEGIFRILAAPILPAQVEKLQATLKTLELYSGPTGGVYDEATQSAVAAYLETLGLPAVERPALTANLLDRLGALD